MIPVARLGDMHVCPIPGHGTSPISSASPDTQINFLGAARVGDVCGCGAVITTGFPSIIVDFRPLAYLGSPTSHGGSVISGSPDTFGGFQFSGAATQAIVDFAKLGAVRPDGSVDDQLMAELLADPQLEQRALLSGALVQPGNSSPTAGKKPLTPELIAVAGSQHDKGSGNKMMFIGQAVRKLAEFKRRKPALTRTLVVFTPSYNPVMLSAARSSANAYGAGFVEVTNAQELIDYLNRGKDRKQSPIEDGIQFFSQTNESLAQLLADHLQIKVRAFIRRSDYKNTWSTFEERQLGKLCGISDNVAPGDEWCRKWGTLKDERKLYHKKHKFTYQTMGAINPVISGDTPLGVPGGHFEFLPK